MKRFLLFGVVIFGLVACSKDSDSKKTETPPIQINQADRVVDWSHRANGSLYTTTQAAEDFGGPKGWEDGKAYIIDGACRVTLEKDELLAVGGLDSRAVLPSGSEYELSFDIKFDTEFDWSRGGKCGLGFEIGQNYNGCRPAWNGDGGSLRIMWYQNDANRVYFIPYVYFKDMPTARL